MGQGAKEKNELGRVERILDFDRRATCGRFQTVDLLEAFRNETRIHVIHVHWI